MVNNFTEHTLNEGRNTITIIVIAENGTSSRTYTISVTRGQITGVENIFAGAVNIFPNPFTCEVRITGAAAAAETRHATSLQIIDAAGVIVYTKIITDNDETINLEHLPAGAYIFRVEKEGEIMTEKIVKK